MNDRLVELIFGLLLHDIGKVIYRTGVMKSHSISGWEFLSEIEHFKENQNIMESVRYHHGRDLASSRLSDSSLAYISYIADNLSAAGDRREGIIEGEEEPGFRFDRSRPLESVFNILKGNNQKYTYSLSTIDEINYPKNIQHKYTTGDYINIKQHIKKQLEGIEISQEYINSILHLLESTLSFVPSSTNMNELADISLYDHSKTTAAIGSCIYYYIKEKDYRKILFEDTKRFYKEKAFILYSADLSGIQSYIYTISGTKALRSLRARSLYLEILLENIMDELLSRLNLSRCNLLYTGGGHGYLLLPNTKETIDTIKEFESELKQWFIEEFDISLFMASGYAPCTGEELAKNIGKVYKRVGKNIAINKTQRYTKADIIKLNTRKRAREERECRECKRTGPTNKGGMCKICGSLIEISPKIVKDNMFFVVSAAKEDLPYGALILPFNQMLEIKSLEEVLDSEYIRVYSKNEPSMGYKFAANLWVGDYTAKSYVDNGIKNFEEFATDSTGINRVGVLRADVDDLGMVFTCGFSKEKGHETLSRTSTLSRQLSMFFKYHINTILSEGKRNALIVYSGGDDMFIVGGWDDCIELARDINTSFKKFTQGVLTMSAGLGIYNHSYPISRMAKEVGELEDAAKTKDIHKNKITLFRKGRVNERMEVLEEDWILSWADIPRLKENVESTNGIEEKLYELRKVLKEDGQNVGRQQGNALLYKMLDLLRESSKDRLNIARYAYLLKKAQERYPMIDISKFYRYINEDKERKELEIAITLYVYENR